MNNVYIQYLGGLLLSSETIERIHNSSFYMHNKYMGYMEIFPFLPLQVSNLLPFAYLSLTSLSSTPSLAFSLLD